MFLKNQTVRKSIIFGYIIALCLMIVIGSIAIFQLQQIKSTVTHLADNLAQDQHIADTIIAQVLSVRFFANKYISNQQTKELVNYEQAFNSFNALLEQADEKVTQAERVQLLENIKVGVNQYQEIFDQVKTIIQKRNSVIDKQLNVEGAQIEQKLSELFKVAKDNEQVISLSDINQLQSSTLLIRINAVKYLEQGEQQWFDEFEKHYQNVITILNSLLQNQLVDDKLSTLLQTIKTTIENYHLHFYTLKEEFIEQHQLVTQGLDVIGPKIREIAAQISSHVTLDFVSANQNTHQLVNNTQWGIGITLFAAVLVCLGFGLMISNNIMAKLGGEPNEVAEIAKKIAEGELNFDIAEKKSGLFGSIQIMHHQLRQRIERDRKIAHDALRINNALENVTTSVLIADAQYNVIYLNRAALELFKKIEPKIRSELPNFHANELLNHSIDMLHKNPQQHRQMLAQLTTSQRASLDVNSVTIDYIVTPVRNAKGEWLGFVKEFKDRTIEVAIEQEINSVIKQASQGNFEQRIELKDKNGFFKLFSQSINQIMQVTQYAIEDIMMMFAALAKGDLNKTITREYVGAFETLKNDANTTVQKLTDIIISMKQTASIVRGAATEISQGNVSLSQRTEEQAASLEQTASSIEQMTSTVKQNADNTAQAKQLALTAKNQAEEGGKIVGQAVSIMLTANESSKKITDIISVIDEIAFQTNLLALNAAVEAARAGEQGRGFAVVATEVRNLAQRSATAAREIKHLIKNSVNKIEEGTRAVEFSGKTLEEIILAIKKVNDIVAEIATATQEQAAGIEQINKAINQMDETTQQNAALVEEAAAASEAMLEQAQNLTQQVEFFYLQTAETTTILPPPALPPQVTFHKPRMTTQVKRAKVEEDGEWMDF